MKNCKNNQFSHINDKNLPQMVDISTKKITKRTASAQSIVKIPQKITKLLNNNEIYTKKGPVFQTAIIAGTMAAKKTSDLIPFCHQIPLDNCKIQISLKKNNIFIKCTAKTNNKTGIEMETLVAASITALTVYDMCKAISHKITISETKLLKKTGGKSDIKI